MWFLKNIFGSRSGGVNNPLKNVRARLNVENLEDRLVPATVLTSNLAVLTPKVVAPAAPAFSTVAVSTQANLSWKAVAGATSYAVDEWVNGAWKQIATVSGTSFSALGLNPNSVYYFDVASVNAAGTVWANFQSVTTLVANPASTYAYSPVSGNLFGTSGPSYLDVEQGVEGDCWLISSLAETAARDPQDIRNMFTYDGTTLENGATVGLYTVRFFSSSGVAKYVEIDTELPDGGGAYDRVDNALGHDVLWVALAEKAYAEANGLGYVTTSFVGTNSYDALGNLQNKGGSPAWALQAITGKGAGAYAINPTNLAADWNAGDLIVLTTKAPPASSYIVGNSTETHCYALVGYNPSSSQPFEVMNPWGTNSSGYAPSTFNGHQVYGQFTANATFMSQNFAWQTIGSGSAANQVADPSGGATTSHLDGILQSPLPTHLLDTGSPASGADLLASQASQWAQNVLEGLDEGFFDARTLGLLNA